MYTCPGHPILIESTDSMITHSSHLKTYFVTTRPVQWIQDNIKEHLITFLSQIEKCDCKDDFRVGYEARQVSTIKSLML